MRTKLTMLNSRETKPVKIHRTDQKWQPWKDLTNKAFWKKCSRNDRILKEKICHKLQKTAPLNLPKMRFCAKIDLESFF